MGQTDFYPGIIKGKEAVNLAVDIGTLNANMDNLGGIPVLVGLAGRSTVNNIPSGTYLKIEDEILRVRSHTNRRTIEADRGQLGTSTVAHSSGTTVTWLNLPYQLSGIVVPQSTGKLRYKGYNGDILTEDVTSGTAVGIGDLSVWIIELLPASDVTVTSIVIGKL